MWFWKGKRRSHYEKLLAKWANRHKKIQENLWYKHGHTLQELGIKAEHFAVGSLAGLALLLSPSSPVHLSPQAVANEKPFKDFDKTSGLILELMQYVPQEVRPLTPDEEVHITQLLTQTFGFPVQAEMEGIRLNTSYGYIGQEQHLARFAGDSIDEHEFASYGMAPGLGAYGYFARSKGPMTQEENLREKYYIAVQTFLAPGYSENTGRYNSFFAFRKMLVINPQNGKALIADIGDAGPSAWTGKQLGGSPEVMKYLERVDGAARGPVLYFFIDDPEDKIPLGPIAYNK